MEFAGLDPIGSICGNSLHEPPHPCADAIGQAQSVAAESNSQRRLEGKGQSLLADAARSCDFWTLPIAFRGS